MTSNRRCAKTTAEDQRPGVTALRHVPGEHADAGNLADPARQHGIAEQPDGEGREDVTVARVGLRQGLPEHDLPGDRSDHDGEEIEADGRGDPAPLDLPETPSDQVEVGGTPDEHSGDGGDCNEHDSGPATPGAEQSLRHAATTSAPTGLPVSPDVDLELAPHDPVPRVALLRDLAGALAERRAPGSSSSRETDASTSASTSPGGTRMPVSGVATSR